MGGSIENNPQKLDGINERLTLINRLKRKYGSTIEEIKAYRQRAADRLEMLENRESEIETLKDLMKLAEKETNRFAMLLSNERHQVAERFGKDLTDQLHSLNMPKSKFIVRITPQKRTSFGDDKVEFLLQPNTGEHEIALKEEASGGEVSRVLLGIQTLLAGKEHIPSIVFDEVDANIGGETAAIVGDKLREIGTKHQVICVTHFPQVAIRADHHLQISKLERDGRTFTEIQVLDNGFRHKELERMVGKSV